MRGALVVLSLFLGTALAQCPQITSQYCRCSPSMTEPVAIICEQAGSLQNIIQAIQPAKGAPIDSLVIMDTAVPSLPANAFQGFTILRLVLNRNTLSQIDDQAFNGELLESLVELDLGDNNLGQIPQSGLPRLLNLRKLYLTRNKITTLQANSFGAYESKDLIVKLSLAGNRLTDRSLGDSTVFRPLKLLQELSLETNALTAIPSAALVNQRLTLTNLNLGLNNITNVPVGALDLPVLTSVSLEFNGITVITPQAFQGVPNLQYLYLTGNKFPSWQPEMYRYVPNLRTLGIGETPISVIPSNAFQYIPNLLRLEMSEAAVDTIERGAFQRTPRIQAIVLNKNRLSQIRADFFQGLNDLYSIDVGANRISNTEPLAFANLPNIQHLDISYNQLQSMPNNVFQNSFLPQPDERRVIYACGNPWLCDSQLEWFRQLLRENLDIDIDKPGCTSVCRASPNNCPPDGTPLRSEDICPLNSETPQAFVSSPLQMVPWIILAIIMTILMIAICMLALVRYGISHKRKKQKDQEIEEDRYLSTAASMFAGPVSTIGPLGIESRPYTSHTGLDLDLPAAHNLDDRPNNYLY
ncbi:unnamed protein product, partial [Mesorhabditis belari]|uniref:Leucine-rich repeat-containing protein 15 n=1 Tax=Mesorhabditis belari TaxID=2138241 RepID=A0AAF3EYX2_9BILA